MTKERYQELKEMMDIPPDVLDEVDSAGGSARVAKFYDLVGELITEFEDVVLRAGYPEGYWTEE